MRIYGVELMADVMVVLSVVLVFFFFQAEDGIRDYKVTGVQTCALPIYPLLAYPAWLRRTIPTGISNDAMGAVPRHPFFIKVIDSLPDYSRNWVLPYITDRKSVV